MVFSRDEDNDGCNDCADEEGQIDLNVGEEDEPLVSGSFFELTSRFGAAYTAGWILSANACIG